MCKLLAELGNREAAKQKAMSALQHLGAPPPLSPLSHQPSLVQKASWLAAACLSPPCTSPPEVSEYSSDVQILCSNFSRYAERF